MEGRESGGWVFEGLSECWMKGLHWRWVEQLRIFRPRRDQSPAFHGRGGGANGRGVDEQWCDVLTTRSVFDGWLGQGQWPLRCQGISWK